MKLKLLTCCFMTSSILSVLTIISSIQPSLGCNLRIVSESGLKTRIINQDFVQGEMTRYIENKKFTESLLDLAIFQKIKNSKIYNYSLHTTENAVFLHGILREGVSESYFIRRKYNFFDILHKITIGLFDTCHPAPMNKILYKSYVIGVFYQPNGKFKNIACQGNEMGFMKLKEPFMQSDKPVCAEGSSVWQEVDLLY